MPAQANTSHVRQLATIQEAARHYRVSPDTIKRRIADGAITAYRFGPKVVRLDLAEIDNAMLRPISRPTGDVA